MNSYIIIGKPNTRKSSTLRCLAGCFGKTRRDIAFADGTEHPVYTTVSSLQEAQIEAKTFITDATASQCTHTIFCLWPDANKKNIVKYPDAKTYVANFQAEGWTIERIAVLGDSTIQYLREYDFKHEAMAYFPNSTTDPLNQTAKAVREHFGWV